jgi:hypothetical protein
MTTFQNSDDWELIHSFDSTAVRDLAWSLLSPPLLSEQLCSWPTLLQEKEEIRDWLRQQAAAPTSLETHLSERPTRRLGLYFESLWSFFLRHYEGVELLAENLQIHRQKRTLGEFDYVYRERRSQRLVHMELAVKFYLGVPTAEQQSPSPWHQWIGPSCRDRFDLKLNKLLTRQTRLAEIPEGREALDSLGVRGEEVQMWVGGVLFQPSPSLFADFPLPVDTWPLLQTGYWTRWSDFVASFDEFPDTWRWELLERLRWLAPPSHPASHSPGSLPSALWELLDKWKQPVQVMAMKEQGGRWWEAQRWFVTPDSWPDPSILVEPL